jgi:exonuclease III
VGLPGRQLLQKDGLRIDLLMTTRSVTDATKVALIDRNERKGPKDDPPSDHAPVFIDVER